MRRSIRRRASPPSLALVTRWEVIGAFGVSVGGGHANVQAQPVAILHQPLRAVTQQRRGVAALPRQPRLRIGGGLMRVVGGLCAAKMYRRIAAAFGRRLVW